jgi:hypothetical protein
MLEASSFIVCYLLLVIVLTSALYYSSMLHLESAFVAALIYALLLSWLISNSILREPCCTKREKNNKAKVCGLIMLISGLTIWILIVYSFYMSIGDRRCVTD